MNYEDRVYNFSAGPSTLPVEVLRQAASEMLNYRGCGMSVMEMSHRTPDFEEILDNAEKDLRLLMEIPENYKVLFLQGGGTLQFAMVPLNLLRNSRKADYILTGSWAEKAAEEALKYGDIRIAASSKEAGYTYVPKVGIEDFREDADYIYVTGNNTIFGTRWTNYPETGDIPLVCDISSGIMSERLDISKFGLLWAGAQKNIGPAGLVIVIIREDLLGFAGKEVPTMLNYKIMADSRSLYNTPPTYSIYVAGLTLRHLIENGGIAVMEKRNIQKANLLYSAIDDSTIFMAPVAKEDRSLMNVVFRAKEEKLNELFISEAKEAGMVNLRGHRSAGGMRASIYNAMPIEGVEKLADFIGEFDRKYS